MKLQIVNRELSWLSFNERVLQEAENPDVPLMERLRFLGIFSSNRDEFFRVRVATLRRMASYKKQATLDLGINPEELLGKVEEKIKKLNKRFEKTYSTIIDDLAKENIYLINENELDKEQGEIVNKYFQENVRLEVFPIMISEDKEFPVLQDSSIYLAIRFMPTKEKVKKYVYSLIEVPSSLSRFLVLPQRAEKTFVIFLDDVIRYNLKEIFHIFDYKKIDAYTIKFTRDAELDLDNDVSQSFLKAVEQGLYKRKSGEPLRFIYDIDMPADFLDFIVNHMDISKRGHLYPGLRYHNFKDFMKFPTIGNKKLWYNYPPQLAHPRLKDAKSILMEIKQRDLLLNYPYHSFDNFLDLLREVTIDPLVSHIRITVYRLSNDSHVIKSLINAVRNGKFVTVVIELRARFDEAANIRWSKRLSDEGVRVITGVSGLKVHSKLCIITRREKGKKIYYGAIGTGNFHEKTARIYTDLFLFTANQDIMLEARELFTFFEKNYIVPKLNKLWVAPFNLRQKMISFINREIRNAKAGHKAEIFMKMNNLVDYEIIMKLYLASKAGVKIRLIVRGICSLIPEIPNISQNIQAISIVDKYLEHSRVFIFHNDGKPLVFIGSADMMARNIDYRVEIITPVLDEIVSNQIIDIMEIQWADNQKARWLNKDQKNLYKTQKLQPVIRSQDEIYHYFEKYLHNQKTIS